MTRQEIINQIKENMGAVPDWLNELPDAVLEHAWGMLSWFMSDTNLKARDKTLVAFGAATAAHCPY
jgi:alkylhydroperoxidase/carboxymuconolactone decarboxylase family protein YurZ